MGVPVGFALVEILDGAAHLEEIDVHPAHGRRGLGSALVRAVCEWARQSELSAVTRISRAWVLLKHRYRLVDSDHAMSKSITCAVLLLTAALPVVFGATSARAQGPALCQPGQSAQSGSSVSLVILSSPKKVQQLAATIRDAQVLKRDAKTVIFSDGRVVTSDVGSASRHLNELGWGKRSINVMASFKARSRRRSSFG